jgi:hypothetical protein
MSRLPLALLVCAALSLACEEPAATDAGPDDTEQCNPNLPEASDVCLEDQCGNEKGVGQPCTRGGGECDDLGFDGAYLCTVDFADTDLWFCTMPCVADDQCGEDARCAVDPEDLSAGSGCFPTVCDDDDPDPLDAGSDGVDDAGSAFDGGPSDAG